MTTPQWLYRLEITALLNLLVDKLDKAQAKGRSIQSVKLDVRILPEPAFTRGPGYGCLTVASMMNIYAKYIPHLLDTKRFFDQPG
ncbi:MAG: hypothetical protein KGZ88_12820 [Methylomicrobium sp.]|nr:hypothetical protein [Methylomicrobium sp.]